MNFAINTLHIVNIFNMLSKLPFYTMLLAMLLLSHSLDAQVKIPIDKRIPKSPEKLDKRDRMDMAIAQEYEMTMDPAMKMVPRYKLEEARKIADQKRADAIENSNSQGAILGINWEERGPNNVGGRTRTLLIDADDPSGNTIFAGSVAGGLWKTTNATDSQANWSKVDDFLENLAVSSIVQDPSNHDILYFSTGEGYFNIDAVQGNGIYKSIDHGLTWTRLTSTEGAVFQFIQRLAIDANGDLFVGTYADGLYRSTDGGSSFQKILGASLWATNNTITDIEIAANGYLYAAIGLYQSDGIYMSPDQGDSWMKLTNGLPSSDLGRIELACAPSNDSYIYAMINSLSTDDCLGIYRSTNGGDNWIEMDNPIMYGNQNFLRQQGWYNMTIAVDPNNESTVFIGGIDIFRSTNAGLSFEQVTQWYGALGLSEIHADQHEIKFAPGNSALLFIGNDGGIYKSENATSAAISFENINQGYNVTQFYSADFHPNAGSSYISAGAQDNGTQLFSQHGMNATVELTGGDGGFTHFDQTDGNTIITTYVYNNFRISTNMGNDFTYRSFGNTGRFINPNDFDDQANIMYSAYNEGAYFRWNDPAELGDSTDIVQVPALSNELISAVYVSPNIDHQIYVGTGNGKLIKIENAHEGTTKTGSILFNGPGYLSSIAVEKSNEAHILVSFSNYGVTSIYESTDGGNSWNNIEGDLPDMPVRWVVFNPHNAEQALIATELGIWSTNKISGESTIWQPSNGGLANVRTDMIKIRESDHMMLAATHGRGLFTTNFFAEAVVNVELDSLQKHELSQLTTDSSCPKDYSIVEVPVFLSSVPDEGGFVRLIIDESNALENTDYFVAEDSIYLDITNMKDAFEIHLFDDAIEENTKYIKASLESSTLDLGLATDIYIGLEDNDISPFNLPETMQLQIGYSNNQEGNTPFKSYYEDEKSQYLFTAEELLDAGILPGPIESLSLHVLEKNSTIPFNQFTVAMDHIDLEAFNLQNPRFEANNGANLYTGNFETQLGWNEITFSSPFIWDGNSNIIIDFCYNNDNFSADDKVAATQVNAFRSQYKYIDGSNGCLLNAIPSLKMQRPNIRFKQTARVFSSQEVAEKRSNTAYPGSNNFYNADNKIILTVEHNTPETSDCFLAKIDQAGTGKQLSWWLNDASVSEKQFYLESEADFEGSINLYFSAEELSSWENIHDLHIVRTSGSISDQNTSLFDLIDKSNILISEIHEDLFAFSFYTTELGGFALTDYAQSSVPVTLVSFEAMRNEESNLLQWIVEAETGINHYIIERSFDGRNFEEIGAMPAYNNSTVENNYYFEDTDLLLTNKNYYYRLKTMENDGKSQYSDVVAVYVDQEDLTHLQCYPNPFKDIIQIELIKSAHNIQQIQLKNIAGQVQLTENSTDLNRSYTLHTGNLLPGVYILEIQDSKGHNFTETIIKN